MISSVEKNYSMNKFIDYKMTLSNGQVWFIPLDEANADYQEIQEWAKIEGNNIIDNGA
tara:strand:- start:138 stop:311 length:174 start_codon:yes stop_codon:yes gene_type:complete